MREKPERSPAQRGVKAERALREAFDQAGWRVEAAERQNSSHQGGDFIARRRNLAYVVEVKAAGESRRDRLIPLWAQAWLQAVRGAGPGQKPLAVIAAPHVSPRVARQILEFAEEHAPGGAAGVIGLDGFWHFRGEQLEELNRAREPRERNGEQVSKAPTDLFSDLNQWMLKVLLAPSIPERWLAAPRAECPNPRTLAQLAGVSQMSAHRLVHALKAEGYLDKRQPELKLVRRVDLMRRWQSRSRARRAREVALRFLHAGPSRNALGPLFHDGLHDGCLALFAAADALGVGFVRGVLPHVYLPRINSWNLDAIKGVVQAEVGEAPDFLVRKPDAPNSVFRGMVRANGLPACDILQVWLDVSSESSRGQEQASEIERKALRAVFDE